MQLKNVKIGFAFTGSFCTFSEVIAELEKLSAAGADITPIISYAVDKFDTRFGSAEQWKIKIEAVTGRSVIRTITEAEPIGPKALFDILVVAPCTGNTLAKLANGITDTPVTMACKAHLRNGRPLLLAPSTNDGLGINAKNIGLLQSCKNIFFVPYRQDDPQRKCNSLVARFDLIIPAIQAALEGRQLEPVLV
ncbi:MAG TPA: dipicolinate synthase subunit B [Clostridiales bacterium]|nr:dipicolinate synthase subunit B [Clostridiales bacterium]HOL92022.1 dipicolinate synthase subunit B [Clostridiales bacterium]HPP35792.1 dipicolinate synthase subunit B [Clostridiales bacterium]